MMSTQTGFDKGLLNDSERPKFDYSFSFGSLVDGKLLTHAIARAQMVGWSVGEDESEEKWMTFSLCLAQSFGSALNIVASSLDTYDQLKKYKRAMSNAIALTKLGATVLHGVDATQMKSHDDLKTREFDRIIFNFPHAGFHGKEDSFSLIQKHKNLVLGFFRNARSMLKSDGEIHVNHKTTPPFNDWCINELGTQSLLWLIECVDFKKEDYPGYTTSEVMGPGLMSLSPWVSVAHSSSSC
ncbi:heavy metal-associated isoprenylated plant protein 41-like [Prosopis cineraria]|uniref:heavy metal-associated isoprenylated plant protein 41-like n=1 Tax=Prosopis cineraria TaxID=364024 RepID=UPI002410974B|nr:heavy metal-associated isoprenylated plant protein 41-like [Prosopis cineraria]